MRKEIDRVLGNSLRCILPSFWWKRLLGMMSDRIDSAQSAANNAQRTAVLIASEISSELSNKQDKLYSGSNIKTINNQSILGSGNITIEAGDGVEQIIFYATENDAYPLTAAEIAHNVESMQKQRTAFLNNTPVSFLVSVKGAGFQICETPSFYLPSNNTDIPVGFYIVCGGSAQVMVTCNWDGTATVEDVKWIDAELSDTSKNPVQNKVIKAYVDEKVANSGGGSSVDVDTELSNTSTNPVQNKVITNAINAKADNTRVDLISERLDDIDNEMRDFATESQLNNKQDVITDLDTIRQGAAKGATALQSIPSEYVTESELTSKGYATTSQVNAKQDSITDLGEIRRGAGLGATALQSVPAEYITESELSAKKYATTSQLAAKQDTISDLSTIRSNASLGATAIQKVKTINGESITGDGNVEIFTKAMHDELVENMLDNEEVYAAAVNDLNTRLVETNATIATEVSTRESLSNDVQSLTDRITSNEEVTATSYNELNDRIEANYQHGEETYATNTSLAEEVAAITTTIVENEEVVAATLNDLLARIDALTTRIEILENA